MADGQLAGAYPLGVRQTLRIGRDRECEVALPHDKVSRFHAHLHVGDKVEVEDLGSTNGTFVAGRRLVEGKREWLVPGQQVKVGPYVAVVLEASGNQGDAAPVRAAVTVLDPTPQGVGEMVARVARGAVSILINGETGTGKEVLAQTLHKLSGRTGELVAINCASLSESLLESELFGHERGAFTGAARAKPGLFEVAAGGTVFLDEIGELPPSLQAKLLRVLETRCVYRVGGVQPVQLDVRFLAATHRDLAEEVARGRFRRDLYFRVNGISLSIPPLRRRLEALPRLAMELLERAVGPGRKPPRLGPDAISLLLRHEWPGNVRELRTVMDRVAVLCQDDEVSPAHILLDATGETAAAPSASDAESIDMGGGGDEEERQRIMAALEECAGNQTRAARKLGISRTTLVHKLVVHRIPRPRRRGGA